MNWRRGILVWILIACVESVHGTIREFFIAPAIGDLPARHISFFIGAGLILLVAWLTAPWLKAHTFKAQLKVGGLWLILMLGFEFGLGYARGFSWEHMLSDYNLAKGGLMSFGLVVMLVAPALGAWLRAKSRCAADISFKADGPVGPRH